MTTQDHLKVFNKWAQYYTQALQTDGVSIEITKSPLSDNPSTRLDIEMPSSIGRITFWSSGDFNEEVIDFETEKTIFFLHGTISAVDKIPDCFGSFIKVFGLKPI